jgi:hypothetical protein
MNPIVVTVGPLASASANNIATSQKMGGAFNLTLNGTLGSGFSATNIATAQAVGSATTLTLNGSLAVAGSTNINGLTTPRAAYLDPAARVTITSVGNDSGITFAVAGIGVDGESSETETVTGANASTVSTTKLFRRIFSITSSGAAAGNVSAGTNGYVATMDKPRRVLITSAGNDSGITWTITGTDWNNAPISEVLTGGNTAAVASLLDYATVAGIKASAAAASTVTVGTNGVAGSRPIGLDQMGLSPTALQVTVSGTVNYTVQQTLDDPNRVGLSSVAWVNHPDSALVAATGTVQGNYAYQPQLTRIVLNSGTGTLTYTVIQSGNIRY